MERLEPVAETPGCKLAVHTMEAVISPSLAVPVKLTVAPDLQLIRTHRPGWLWKLSVGPYLAFAGFKIHRQSAGNEDALDIFRGAG